MRKLLIFIVLMCTYCLEGQSQEKKRIYVGLDVFKSLVPLFDKKGYYDQATIIEPHLRIETAQRVFLNFQIGYSDIGKKVVYTNFREYQNKGAYFKAGILYAMWDDELDNSHVGFSSGLSFVVAGCKESGYANLEGPVYGNLQIPLANSHRSLWVELPVNVLVKISSRWKLNMQTRLNVVAYHHASNNSIPLYYTPGVGSNYQKYQDKSSLPGRTVTGGLTFQLFYKLR